MPDQSSCLCDKMIGSTGEGIMRDVIYIHFSKAFNIVFYHAFACNLGH